MLLSLQKYHCLFKAIHSKGAILWRAWIDVELGAHKNRETQKLFLWAEGENLIDSEWHSKE